jgi:hypothetical protein
VADALEGGCLCGGIRYRVTGEPITVVYCHCSSCRRASGAPVVAWSMWPLERFAITRGRPTANASSPGVERTFCGGCGTPIGYTAHYMPGFVDVTVASLDTPDALPPHLHIWDSERVRWLELADRLPRHPDAPLPPGTGKSS